MIAVLLMVVAILAGSRVLAVLELPQAVPAWLLFAVGAHFVPFAKIFGSGRSARVRSLQGRGRLGRRHLARRRGRAVAFDGLRHELHEGRRCGGLAQHRLRQSGTGTHLSRAVPDR
ncbi:hypothetical protein SK571_40555 [Lentzea sp. BCCO 10_0798]|uniref:Uncharacterized protein n=1 Tax=Lentzea kristufekii TaxID=3095430 RepID=A0ABU4U5B6_9PSEU|nr:hypothetical protein [Lentzea sp. BCCO 10_0798]MDX8055706.1 hypothetical protein [Lentzea sp. BCCO 10_0798]